MKYSNCHRLFISPVAVLLIFIFPVSAQTAKETLIRRMTEELTTRGVISNQSDFWGHNKRANEKIMELVRRNFSLNEALLGKPIKNKSAILSSMSDLGRRIYSTETPEGYDVFIHREKFPCLANGKLLSIESANQGLSNFRLYYSLMDILEGAGSINASGGLRGVIDGRVRTAAEYQNKNETQFTAVVGTFDNYLVKAFDRIKLNTIGNDDVPVFTSLWSMYSNGTLDPEKNYFIIASADALILSVSDQNRFGKRIDFDASINASVRVPWARANANADVKWGKSSDMEINNNSFEIFFIENPIMYNVPTYAQLIRAWNTVSINNTDKYFVERSPIFFQNNEPISRYVRFGPFSDPDLINSITIDADAFIKSQGTKPVIKSPFVKSRTIKPDNLLELVISFEPNTDWINDQSNETTISSEAQLLIQYTAADEKYNLKRTYPMSFSAAVMARQKPIGSIGDPQISEDGRTYNWNFKINYDNLPRVVSSENMFNGNFLFDDNRINQIFNVNGISPLVEVVRDQANGNAVNVMVKTAIPVDKLSENDKFLRCSFDILIKYDSRPQTNKPTFDKQLKRRISINLPGVRPVIQKDIQNAKVFASLEEILPSLKEDIKIGDLTIKDFKIKYDAATADDKKTLLKSMADQLGIPMKDDKYMVPLFLLQAK